MSCIKFPSSKNEISKTSCKENINDYAKASSELITIADQFFGNNNWSHSIINQTLDFIDFSAGKYQAGCASIVRIQLNNGIFHEDIGYSNSEGSSKGSAIQRARLGSFNTAFKKTLMYFGHGLASKINGSSFSRSSSPMPVEPLINQQLCIETNTSSTKNKIDAEPFVETITLSQTDAIMGNVDFDQLILKNEKSNNVHTANKSIKVDIQKQDITAQTEKDTLNNIKGTNKEVVAESLSNVITLQDNKSNLCRGIKVESRSEPVKVAVYTAMTEEEMRLERKRKQREMQEEFKRREEFKKKHGDGGSKQPPNPRY